MSVRFLGIAGFGLALAAGYALHALDPTREPAGVGSVLARSNHPGDRPKAAEAWGQAVRTDSANAFTWASFGEALRAAGRVEQGRAVLQRALELAPSVPQIWFNDAVFQFELGDVASGLQAVSRMLEQVSAYDDVFFNYFDRLQLTPNDVLPHLQHNRRAAQSYTEHLVLVDNVDAAGQAWHVLLERGFADDRLTGHYISCLLKNHRYETAAIDWAAAQHTPEYPEKNLIFNGDFERETTGCPLDWEIQPSDQFETTRDNSFAHEGHWSLKLSFHGDRNVSYANVVQVVPVRAGRYHFQAWIRTDGITTDEGIRINILDPESPERLNILTPSIKGTTAWMPIDALFDVLGSTQVMRVQVVRSRSMKFDNAIAGKAWLDSFSLKRDATLSR